MPVSGQTAHTAPARVLEFPAVSRRLMTLPFM